MSDRSSVKSGLIETEFAAEMTPGLAELVQDLRELAAWALEDHQPPDERPLLIGRFRVVDYLGGGGQAMLWLAYEAELQRFVVLKRYRPGSLAGSGCALAEARAICAVRHPNLIVCHAFETDASGDFLVLEPISGRSLNHILGRRSVALERLFSWFRDLADAVAALHARGLAHRDIAARNVVIDSQDRAVLVDLGLAAGDLVGSDSSGGALAERGGSREDVLALWRLLQDSVRRAERASLLQVDRKFWRRLVAWGRDPGTAEELRDWIQGERESLRELVDRRRFWGRAGAVTLAIGSVFVWRVTNREADTDWDPQYGRRCWRDYLATVRGMPVDAETRPPALPHEIPAMLIGSGVAQAWEQSIEVVSGESMEIEIRSTEPVLLSAFRLRTRRGAAASVIGLPIDLGLDRDVPSFRWRLSLEAPDPEAIEFLYLIAADARFDGRIPIPGPSVMFRMATGELVPALPPGEANWISERVVRLVAV